MTNRKQAVVDERQFNDSLSFQLYLNSTKVYVEANCPNIRVPMLETFLFFCLIGVSKENPDNEVRWQDFFNLSLDHDTAHVYQSDILYQMFGKVFRLCSLKLPYINGLKSNTDIDAKPLGGIKKISAEFRVQGSQLYKLTEKARDSQ